MSRLLAAVLLCLAVTVAAQKAPSRPAQQVDQLLQAEAAMDREAWPEAEAILRKMIAANPKDARAWFDLGYVMHAQKNYPEAIAAYQGAVKTQPQSFECNLNLGLMLAHEHRPEAVQVLEAATHLKPTTDHPQQSMARAWSALAELQEASNPAQAADSWGKAVELAPADTDSRLGYATALERAGKSAEAEAQLQKAAELAPSSADVLAAEASFYLRARRLPEAEQTLTKLLAAPANQNAHLELGRVLSAEKRYPEAIAELQKALALHPEDWDALRELAYAQEQGKQNDAAAASYRRLVEHFPADAELHNGLGTVLLAQLHYAEARDEFVRSVKLRPQWGEAYGQLALAASGNKEYELALKALDERKKLLPEVPASLFLRATCFDHLKQYAEAVDAYKTFLATDQGQFPDEEWKARHRLIAIEPEAKRKR
jgi:tetratricopeptide (TPR) repeat protein